MVSDLSNDHTRWLCAACSLPWGYGPRRPRGGGSVRPVVSQSRMAWHNRGIFVVVNGKIAIKEGASRCESYLCFVGCAKPR